MQNHETPNDAAPKPAPWNKGKLIGPKPPLRPKHVWAIRTKLQLEGRTRNWAMFNVAIDSKLRGCDVVKPKVRTWLRTDRPWTGQRCGKGRLASRSGSS